jgi:hypothetical protein
MQRQTALLVLMVGLFSILCFSCGPSCPETKTAMSKNDLAKDDASRVNELVACRKSLMEEATSGERDKFAMERIKFSVTAYELAIQMQLRIIELASSSSLYDANIEEIQETRCMLDNLLEKKAIKKEDLTMSDIKGRSIQKRFALFRKLFGKEGETSNYELKEYFQKGIKVEAKAEEESGDEGESSMDESMGSEDEESGGKSEEEESNVDDFLE